MFRRIKFHLFISILFWISFFPFFAFSQSINTNSFFPEPIGPYQIGTMEWSLTDSSRKEPFKKSQYRRIHIKIWYPAHIDTTKTTELYLHNYSAELITDIFKSKDFSNDWLNEVKKYSIHSQENAPIDLSGRTYPLIIFTPGYYFGMAELYTSYMEFLSSQGYIVCCISHPYEQPYIKFGEDDEVFLKKKRTQWAYLQLVVANWFQFRKKDSPENIEKITRYYHKMLRRFKKALKLWTADTQFFIDYVFAEQLKNPQNEMVQAMNLQQIGAIGQSFGGAVTGQLCLLDERVKAGINLDCFQFGQVIDQHLEQPFMLIQSDYQPSWNLGNTINYRDSKGDFSLLFIPNASHFIFSDGALLPYSSEEFKRNMIGNVNGPEAMEMMNTYILDFFNHYVKGEPATILKKNENNSLYQYHFRGGN